MKLKKVNVSKELKKITAKKRIFVPELDSNLNSNVKKNKKFNLVLTDKSGEFSLNIPLRDSVGRLKRNKTVTFTPDKPLNLLEVMTESDLSKSKEVQEAIDKNILKYVQEDLDVLRPKPKVSFKNIIQVPFEDRIKVEQETFGGADSNQVNMVQSEGLKMVDSQTYYNFKIYAYGSTVKEDIYDLNYRYAVLDENGKALLKIPIKLSSTDSVKLGINFSDQTLYSFRNSSLPNGDVISPAININTVTDLRPDKYELWVYVFYRPSEIYENPINDLGPKRIQKVTVDVAQKNTFIQNQYTITTTAVAPLLDASGSGDV